MSEMEKLLERLVRRNTEILELKREKWKLEGEVLAMAQTLRDIAAPPEGASEDYGRERAKAMMFIMEPRIGVSNKSLTAALWGPAPEGGFQMKMARPLEDWHEDCGDVVWWCWEGNRWLGEPAHIGSPISSDWPGYHTHWTPHPKFPAALEGGGAA